MAAPRGVRAASAAFSEIEELIGRDLGNRGIGPLRLTGQVEATARDLRGTSQVGLLTGFPCLIGMKPPTENDGFAGSGAVALALLRLGKRVTLLTDEVNQQVAEGWIQWLSKQDGVDRNLLQLEVFPGPSKWSNDWSSRLARQLERCDHFVAIERAGVSSSGTYKTMRGLVMSDIAPLDCLFETITTRDIVHSPIAALNAGQDLLKQQLMAAIAKKEGLKCSAVGDGGNELGMGTVLKKVQEHVSSDIACTVAANNLIVAGVSDWGGYGIAAALAVDNTNVELLMNAEELGGLLDALSDAGAKDGIRKTGGRSVDNLEFEVHCDVLHSLHEIAKHTQPLE